MCVCVGGVVLCVHEHQSMCQSRGLRDNLRRESVFSFLQVYPGDQPYVVSLVATSLLNILA